MYEGWLALAGTELVNNERVTVYAEKLGIAGVGCASCANLHTALGDAAYVAPDVDEAPWYDPRFAASARFAGFLGMGLTGLGGTAARTPVQMRDGSLIGPVRRGQREIGVTCLGVAADEEALSYGVAWLASALRGAVCPTCRGDYACLYAACPAGTGVDQYRTIADTGLLEGPTVSERQHLGASCEGLSEGVIATVEYTLVAGTPYLYHEPHTVTMPRPVQVANAFVDPPPACPGDPCRTDPNCTQVSARPSIPVPTNPCECAWPTNPAAMIWATSLTVPDDQLGRWVETVPVVSIYAGSGDLTCVRLRFHRNPQGGDCPPLGGKDPCNFCDQFGVTFLPAGSTLTVDGRNRSVTLNCGDTPVPLGPYLYSSAGRAFSWPVFDCPGGLCVDFVAVTANAATKVSIDLVEREDAL